MLFVFLFLKQKNEDHNRLSYPGISVTSSIACEYQALYEWILLH